MARFLRKHFGRFRRDIRRVRQFGVKTYGIYKGARRAYSKYRPYYDAARALF